MSDHREHRMQSRLWYWSGALLVGVVLGLLYAWKISPVRYVDTDPSALRADFKDQYRLTIALAYLSTGNLERARARLALLGDPDPAGALTDQAQRWLAQGETGEENRALLTLAEALAPRREAETASPTTGTQGADLPSPTPPATNQAATTPSPTQRTGTSRAFTPPASPTPRPTRTPTPTVGPPFRLAEHKTICDPALPEGLLQVEVRDGSGQPLAGVEIVITWPGGEEHFFTGLKPELGNGYADYQMTPGILYTLRLLPASALLTDLSAPPCGERGQEYWGGLRLTFEQR